MNNKMLTALNKQINREMYSAYLYLSMAAYFNNNNLKGFANWMKVQAHEEMQHAMKMYDYVLECGETIKLLPIEAPENDWKSPLEIFKTTLAHEQEVTKMINNLVAIAIETKDYATQNFLQWYVAEQIEEEANASEILAKIKMVGDSPAMLFLDAELGKRT